MYKYEKLCVHANKQITNKLVNVPCIELQTNMTTMYDMLNATITILLYQTAKNVTENSTNLFTETDSSIVAFGKMYGKMHGYISNVVCVFGVLSNILNVIVLTRRHMITPTNCLLTALAIADFSMMLTYLVYATYFHIAKDAKPEANHSKGWMYFIIIHNHFIITCHNMAMWFTVALAVFRYIFVCHHAIGNRLCSLKRAILTITIIVIATIIVCIPNYFLYQVILASRYFEKNISGYWIVYSDFATTHTFYKVSIFWFFGVIMKVAPCILLTFLSSMIIRTMQQASKRRVRLLQQTKSSDHDVNREHNRTTWMLVSVVLCFVITEMPQGILAMISGLSDHFFMEIYSNLGDAMDLLVLLNSAVNFILYCIMSQRFRYTFRNLFVMNWICRHSRYGKVNGKHQNGMSNYTNATTTEVTML